MTGRELINWIIKNHAEEKEILIEHRDEGGSYHTAERLEKPSFCTFSDEEWGVINTIIYNCKEPTAIIL